jgi:hypothetical protein
MLREGECAGPGGSGETVLVARAVVGAICE